MFFVTPLLILTLAAAASAAQPALVVVTGVGGEARFDESFHAWAATLMDAATGRYGLPASSVVYLAGDPDRDPGRARGRSTRENVKATFAELAASLPPDAPLFVVVIGHGSFRDGVSKVNLPGPDMTAEDFAAALAPFGERPVVFADLTSASGGFVDVLSAPHRVVVTATKSGMERNAAIFARFFVSAFVGTDADADNDGSLTVQEAFDYARREVERDYGREQKLLTEHAVLDDPSALAAKLMLTGVAGVPAATDDPQLARLYREKAGLEEDVAELRRRKESLAKDEYEDRLEELLIRLALVHREIRQREDGGAF